MPDTSRRNFLKQLISIPLAAATAVRAIGQSSAPFDLLAVGDSLVWGQGLEESDKFYTHVRNWLALRESVNLKIKAHSGATLTINQNEEAGLKKAGKTDATTFLDPEVNVGFPSISAQLETARAEYSDPRSVRLILISGGITDLSVATILNPFGDNSKLRIDVANYCGTVFANVLGRAAGLFPNALIAVVGYFPMISSKTRTQDLINFALEAYGFPRPLKPIANNPLTHPLLRPMIVKKSLKRSRIWIEESERAMRGAVDQLNGRSGSTRAVFVKSPITEENTYGTKETLVFRMLKRGRIEDSLYDHRRERCGPELKKLRTETGLEYPVRFCDMAAVGHPNPMGSKAIAESIITAVTPFLD